MDSQPMLQKKRSRDPSGDGSDDLQRVSPPPAEFSCLQADIDAHPSANGALADSSTVNDKPHPSEQLSIIKQLMEKPLALGEEWYLLDKKWFIRWKQYCRRASSSSDATTALAQGTFPGAISNESIFEGSSHSKLRPGLITDTDILLLPKEGWDKLVAWYGCNHPPTTRKVISVGTFTPTLIVELYPPQFQLLTVVSPTNSELTDSETSLPPTPPNDEIPEVTVSRRATIEELKATIASKMGSNAFRLWRITSDGFDIKSSTISADHLAKATRIAEQDDSKSIEELGLELEKSLAVEFQNGDGTWLSDSIDSASSNDSAPSIDWGAFSSIRSFSPFTSSFSTPLSSSTVSTSTTAFGPTPESNAPPSKPRGITGLQNLGNTCFMNSALQCLSNSKELTQYFLSGKYKQELNPDNPLGMRGEVAEAYGNLIQKLWSGTASSFAPREFKFTIGRFAPSFVGYQQQDSQELLAFLLDGLHEDLNRIRKKPYIEIPDWPEGTPDEEIASKSWAFHKARNDSIIVDLFQGQYKSTLVCPECQKVSVTFDPFMFLSLPLPISKKTKLSFIYVPYDPFSRPTKMSLVLPKGAFIRQLHEALAQKLSIDSDSLITTEVYGKCIYKVYHTSEQVAEISSTDTIYIYQLPCKIPTHRNGETVVIPVTNTYARENSSHYTHSPHEFFGIPMMIALDAKAAADPDAIYREILKQYQRYTTANIMEETKNLSEVIETKDKTDEAIVTNDQEMETKDAVNEVENDPLENGKEELEEEDAEINKMPSHYFSVKVGTSNRRRLSYSYTKEHIVPNSYSLGSKLVDLREHLREDAMDLVTSPPAAAATPVEALTNGFTPDLSDDDEIYPRPIPMTATTGSEDDEEASGGMESGQTRALKIGDVLVCEWPRAIASQIFHEENAYVRVEKQVIGRARWDDMVVQTGSPELTVQKRSTVTLQDCVDEFMREERLGEDDLWYCPRCREHRQATKKFDLWKLPEVLVVHLKRFSHTRYHRDKIDAFVDFPLTGLDLTSKVVRKDEGLVYDLFAVSNHFGGLGGGHYTAYAFNSEQEKWYNFDDSHVSPVDGDQIKSSAAYLLFYRRRSSKLQPTKVTQPRFDDDFVRNSPANSIASSSLALTEDEDDAETEDDKAQRDLVLSTSSSRSESTERVMGTRHLSLSTPVDRAGSPQVAEYGSDVSEAPSSSSEEEAYDRMREETDEADELLGGSQHNEEDEDMA
ncbi:uncharacterized protein VTP21DRAFT_4220 [Calcarisporiella thermophila]|uniref:uncharacterized protein n=1 Tax=Calcarisporiella thermophila TaxID=911321 RepID=UPI003743D703